MSGPFGVQEVWLGRLSDMLLEAECWHVESGV